MANGRHKAHVVYLSSDKKQAVLEGDFSGAQPGTEYEACQPTNGQERKATLTVQASAGGLAIAGIEMASEFEKPWKLLGWRVSRAGGALP